MADASDIAALVERLKKLADALLEINRDWQRDCYEAAEALSAAREETWDIDAGAKYLSEKVMRYAWEGLRPDGRCTDDGYPAWTIGGHCTARQEDYRDAVRGIVAALRSRARPDNRTETET